MKQMLSNVIAAAFVAIAGAGLAHAEGEAVDIPHQDWTFSGPFGTWDEAQLQRGFVIFSQNCSSCHSMSRVKYRHLSGIGLSEEHIEMIASEQTITVIDGNGEEVERPRLPTDTFPWAPGNRAAAAALYGKAPPDFSRLALAREDTADYIYALLTGYNDEKSAKLTKEAQQADPNASEVVYNDYYGHTGGQIAMVNPLTETKVSDINYGDGVGSEYLTVDQAARDITAFMMWAADPTMVDRKRLGVSVTLFMLLFTLMAWLAYRSIARKVKRELAEDGGGPWDRD